MSDVLPDAGAITPAADAQPASADVTPNNDLPDLLAEGVNADGAVKEGENKAENPTDADGKPEGEKPAEEKPIEYTDFTLPDGMKPDETILGQFKEMAQSANLPQEQAQKLVDMASAIVKKSEEATYNLWKETNERWTNEVKSDSELGGQKFDNMRSTINKAIKQNFDGAGEKKLREALTMTGAANNPEILRLLHRLSSKVTEGKFVPGQPPSGSKSAADILYPKQD